MFKLWDFRKELGFVGIADNFEPDTSYLAALLSSHVLLDVSSTSSLTSVMPVSIHADSALQRRQLPLVA